MQHTCQQVKKTTLCKACNFLQAVKVTFLGIDGIVRVYDRVAVTLQ